MFERRTRFVIAALLLAAPMFLAGCWADYDCNSPVITDTVLALVKERSRLPSTTEYALSSIRTDAKDPNAHTVSCSAEVTGEFRGAPYSTAHLRYFLSRQADGQVMVRVDGISGLRFP